MPDWLLSAALGQCLCLMLGCSCTFLSRFGFHCYNSRHISRWLSSEFEHALSFIFISPQSVYWLEHYSSKLSYLGEWGFPWGCSQEAPVKRILWDAPKMSLSLFIQTSGMSDLGKIPLRVLDKLINGLLVFCPFVLFLQAETELCYIAYQMHFDFIILTHFEKLVVSSF